MLIERLDQLLAEKRISQKQLIETCGIGKNQFAYWRKNHNIPSGKVLDKIANYLSFYQMNNVSRKVHLSPKIRKCHRKNTRSPKIQKYK